MSLDGSPGPSSYSGDHDGIAEDIGKSGKVKFYEKCVLGKGSMGTIVHKGIYEDHLKVAVKVVPKHAIASLNESVILRELHHANIVRYFLIDEERTARILVFELCEGCLVDLIVNTEKFSIPKIENWLKLSLAEDISKGLNYLHSRSPGIIHGDIKPQNILIRKDVHVYSENVITLTAVIADFGISLNVNPDKSKMTAHENIIGSDGWRPKEILDMLKDGETVRATKAVDIFSFGCVLHYIMASKGTGYYMHPFGHPDHRNPHIRTERRKTYLSHQDQLNIDVVLADMLIEECVNGDPRKRPTVQEIAKFPLFWKKPKFIWFLEMAANELYNDNRFNQKTFTEALERSWSLLHQECYSTKIPEACATYTRCKSKKKFNKIYHFLKMLRNIRQHKGEILMKNLALKDILGNGTDDDFYDYFVCRVVEAFPVVYTEFFGHPKIELEEFSDYYVHSGNEAEVKNHIKMDIYKMVQQKVFLGNNPVLNRSRS